MQVGSVTQVDGLNDYQTQEHSIFKEFKWELPFIGKSQNPVDMQISKSKDGWIGVQCVHTATKPSPHLTTSHIESAAHVLGDAKGVQEVFRTNPKYHEMMQAVCVSVEAQDACTLGMRMKEEKDGISTLGFSSGYTEETYTMMQVGGIDFSKDRIVTRASLEKALPRFAICPVALIHFKGEENTTCNWPYLTNDAVSYLMERGVAIVGLNIPSIDRESDGGYASNHKKVFADQNKLIVESLSLDTIKKGKMQVKLNPYNFGDFTDVVNCHPLVYI